MDAIDELDLLESIDQLVRLMLGFVGVCLDHQLRKFLDLFGPVFSTTAMVGFRFAGFSHC